MPRANSLSDLFDYQEYYNEGHFKELLENIEGLDIQRKLSDKKNEKKTLVTMGEIYKK